MTQKKQTQDLLLTRVFYDMLDVLKEGGINIAEKRTLWAIEAMNKRDNRTFPLKKTHDKKS